MKKSFSGSVLICGAPVEFTVVTEWDDYNEALSHDGGSYYQPTHEATWSHDGSKYSLTIEDTSCGDFGSRVYATLDKDGALVCAASYGSLASLPYTDFRCDVDAVALDIAARIGYHIPTR